MDAEGLRTLLKRDRLVGRGQSSLFSGRGSIFFRVDGIRLRLGLAEEIASYRAAWSKTHSRAPKYNELVFPAPNRPGEPMTRQADDKTFRATCAALGIFGASLHS